MRQLVSPAGGLTRLLGGMPDHSCLTSRIAGSHASEGDDDFRVQDIIWGVILIIARMRWLSSLTTNGSFVGDGGD